jgi:acetolactate synthase-1/2/3 large subunit
MELAESKDQTGSEQLVSALLRAGVDVMFANPGTTEMCVVDALDSVPGMRAILGLHENVVTGAADGYGRMSGRPASTLLHLGVGLSNGIANLHNARRASSPVINFVGDMATWHLDTDPLLAMDIAALAGTVSTDVRSPSSASQIATDTTQALEVIRQFRAGASRVATVILPHDATRETSNMALHTALPVGGGMGGGVGGGGAGGGLLGDASGEMVLSEFESAMRLDEALLGGGGLGGGLGGVREHGMM